MERQVGGIDAFGSELFEDRRSTAVLRVGDGFEVLPPVVGSDPVLVVDTGLIDRSDPGEIDGMVHENMLTGSPCLFKLQIPLLSIGIGLVCAVLATGRSGVYHRLGTIRSDAQSDRTVVGNIEEIAVVGLVRHEVQKCALVQDNWINRMNHKTADRRDGLSPKGGAKFTKKNDSRGLGSHESNENQMDQIKIK